MLAPLIADAHLMDTTDLRRVRLMMEDFPKSHNLILLAQPELLNELDRAVMPKKVFSPYALGLIIRSSEGILRRARTP